MAETAKVLEGGAVSELRQCPHDFHHPLSGNPDYPHSCDGCWCEGERDRRMYRWPHNTEPANHPHEEHR